MSAVDSSYVIVPRFTSLAGATSFTSLAQDTSAYGGAQFQVWRGPFRVRSASPTANGIKLHAAPERLPLAPRPG